MKISGEVRGDESVIVGLRADGVRVRDAVRAAIEKLTQRLARRVTSGALAGQVLKRRTGTLARSVAASPIVVVQGDLIDGVVGTNVEYGRVHEYGFSGKVNVPEHLSTSRKGKRFSVRAHQRQIRLPERSFLRSTLRGMGDEARREIEAAVQESSRA